MVIEDQSNQHYKRKYTTIILLIILIATYSLYYTTFIYALGDYAKGITHHFEFVRKYIDAK